VTLQHVALETRRADAEAALAFWALLGFARAQPPESLRERAAWVQRGATQIHLLFAEEPVVPPSGHVAVVLDDYDATLERLRAAGFPAEPRRPCWGAQRAYLYAPGGHRVEVMAFPPGPGPGADA